MEVIETERSSVSPLTDVIATAARLADLFRSSSFPRSSEFPTEELRGLKEAGLLTIALPNDLGGHNIGLHPELQTSLLTTLKEVGRGSLPLGRLFEGHINALLLVEAFGSKRQLREAADAVVDHQQVFGVWNTGPQGSPQLIPLPSGSYRLSGSKTFATGVLRIQKAMVTAALPDGGWQMCLVPLTAGHFHTRRDTWNPLGMEASESFTVDFLDLPLSPEALIGKPGDYYAEPTFTAGAFRFSAVQLGGAQALFDSCRNFIHTLGRENDPFQLQRIGQMAVLLESGNQWLTRAGQWLEESFVDIKHLAAHAQMVRIAIEEICTRIIQLVQLCIGARGMAVSEPFAHTLRDLQMYLRQAGFDHAFQTVGRYALQEHPVHG